MLSRNRSLAILIGVLLIELFVFSYQAHNNRDIPILRQAARLVLTPIEQGIRSTVSGTGNLWHDYVDLRGTRRENSQLRRELEEVKLANQNLSESMAESQRLKKLLDFREQSQLQVIAAKIIGSGGNENSRLIVLNKGTVQGILPDMPVMVPEGVIGKVLRVFLNSSQVLLLTDESSGVASLMESSRIHGILKGKNRTIALMDYVSNDDKVVIGERIFTSGEDRVFPKGLPVGVVVGARPGASFQEIQVQPLARLDRLEEVLIVTSRVDQELPSVGEAGRTIAEMPSIASPPNQPAAAVVQAVTPVAPPTVQVAKQAPPIAAASGQTVTQSPQVGEHVPTVAPSATRVNTAPKPAQQPSQAVAQKPPAPKPPVETAKPATVMAKPEISPAPATGTPTGAARPIAKPDGQ